MQNRYRPFFTSLEQLAKETFKKVSPDLQPSIFIVGIPLTPSLGNSSLGNDDYWLLKSRSSNSCVEVSKHYPWLASVRDSEEYTRTIAGHEPKTSVFTSKNSLLREENEALVKCLEIEFGGRFAGKQAFVAGTSNSSESVFLVCLVEKESYHTLSSLPDKTSLVDYVWMELWGLHFASLESDEIFSLKPVPGEPELLLQLAAKRMMVKIADDLGLGTSSEVYRLFDYIQDLSKTSYERLSCSGLIFLGELSTSVTLKSELYLHQTRMARKLLEATFEDLALVVGASGIKGFTNQNDLQDAIGYSVQINGASNWILFYKQNVLFQIEGGYVRTPKSRNEKDRFRKVLEEKGLYRGRVFNDIFDDIVQTLLSLNHGSILIISEVAESEAVRLQQNALLLGEGLPLSQELTKSFAAIDGAILIDPDGLCYAFGAIMDGEAPSGYGELERGSRYNSTLRYIFTQIKSRGNKCIALVRSDDGMSDYFPLEAKETG